MSMMGIARSPGDDGAAPAGAPASPAARLRGLTRLGNIMVLVFIVGLGGWAAFAPLESAAIAAGVIEAETKRKSVQHYEGGIVRDILVRDGDVVQAGQTLIRLDDTKVRTKADLLQAQLWNTRAREARLNAELGGGATLVFPDRLAAAAGVDRSVAALLAGQRAVFDTGRAVAEAEDEITAERIAQLVQEIVGLEAQRGAAEDRLALAQREIADVERLVDRGLAPRPRLLALQREEVEVVGRRAEALARIARTRQAIAEAKADLLKLQRDRQKETTQALVDAQNRALQLAEMLEVARDELARLEVRAPEDGVVTDLRVRTPGGTISPGAPLLDVTPRDDRPVVRARLRPEDIDVVRHGLPAEVHLVAYNHRRARPLHGIVTHLSADGLTDPRTGEMYYAMTVAIRDDLAGRGDIEVLLGMPVQIFVKTGETTVALYAFAPLLDSLNRAFRED
ncbi:HlyD family type I secretion periplasmic adaptor subunit [Acuticoccus sp.]|uniref:HlyD family type I secretion periplasmic adaptor subunit n=1 Tax=Acuticoccus sp. TaxID=1904378 RepID=UPI003B52D83F